MSGLGLLLIQLGKGRHGLGLATILGLTQLIQDNKGRQMMARMGGMKR